MNPPKTLDYQFPGTLVILKALSTSVLALLLIFIVYTTQATEKASTLNHYSSAQSLLAAEVSSRLLVEQSLQIIDQLNRQGPKLNAVIEVNPDALTIARNLDDDPARGPLEGLPVLLKDNIETGDQLMTSAGSWALAAEPAQADAFIVQKLRQAGSVIVGKANLSEWANFRSSQAISGWSGRGGQTKNPYVLDRSPCGSSSGSAVAVASGMVALAVGTETDGSILCPASMNGIVGIKPTLGLVSRKGIIPLAHSQDTAGPMARTVADAALLLTVMAGTDKADPYTAQADNYAEDFTRHLTLDGLQGKRLGVVASKTGHHRGTDAVFHKAIESLKAAGAIIVEDVVLPNIEALSEPEFEVLLYEFKHDINRYLAERNHPQAASLADLIQFNLDNLERQMPWFAQETFELANSKGPLTEPAYQQALARAKNLSGPQGIDAALAQYNLDALIAPAYTPAFPIDPVLGDGKIIAASSPAAVSGYPSITVPAGLVHELPVGLVFFSHKWSDAELIRMAYAFEQIHRAWQAPKFIPSLVPSD